MYKVVTGSNFLLFTKPKVDLLCIVASAAFTIKPESMAIEKSMKNHIWIIKGTLPKGRFSWPVLEVQPRVSKLYCPGQDKAKLIMPQKVQTCPAYPTMNGKEMKASLGKSNLKE